MKKYRIVFWISKHPPLETEFEDMMKLGGTVRVDYREFWPSAEALYYHLASFGAPVLAVVVLPEAFVRALYRIIEEKGAQIDVAQPLMEPVQTLPPSAPEERGRDTVVQCYRDKCVKYKYRGLYKIRYTAEDSENTIKECKIMERL